MYLEIRFCKKIYLYITQYNVVVYTRVIGPFFFLYYIAIVQKYFESVLVCFHKSIK